MLGLSGSWLPVNIDWHEIADNNLALLEENVLALAKMRKSQHLAIVSLPTKHG